MYIEYDGQPLHDPGGSMALSGKLRLSSSCSPTLSLGIDRTHPLASSGFALRDPEREVVATEGGRVVFRGHVLSAEADMYGTLNVECEGDMAYLGDTLLRPYSTYDDADMEANAPANAGDLMRCFLESHNANAGSPKAFAMGRNEGAAFGEVRRRSTQWPTVLSEMRDKLLDVGGFLYVRHEDGARILDWLCEAPEAVQRIEFGENLLDFARTRDGADVVTAIVPVGKGADGGEVTVEPLPDQGYEGCLKVGDRVQSALGVSAHGVVEERRTYDASTPQGLLERAAADLAEAVQAIETVEVSALDLSAIDPSAQPLEACQWVRVTSEPHGFDALMLCVEAEIDICEPQNSRFTLGAERRTLTGQESKRTNAMRSTLAEVAEQVPAISQKAKDAAAAASQAVIAGYDEYAVSDSPNDPPAEGWSASSTGWEPGRYVWRRAVTAYGDGTVEYGEPACITGNSGEDAALTVITSTNGSTFKNSRISTTLEVTVYYGSQRIQDADALKAAFGAAARVEWSWRRLGESAYGTISASDSRLSNGGFALTISPDDVDAKTDFEANIVV